MRSISPSQPFYYGRINDQPLDVIHLGNVGPFYTYESFLEMRLTECRWKSVWTILVNRPWMEKIPAISIYVSSIWFDLWSRDKQACEPKLTHGDVKLQNMVFVKSQDNGPEKESLEERDVVLIDWESLAWLPAWVEIDNLDGEFRLDDGEAACRCMSAFVKAIKPFPLGEAMASRFTIGSMILRGYQEQP